MSALVKTAAPEAASVTPAPRGRGRPLPLAYSVTLGVLVTAATTYGLVTRPYRLVSDLLASTWMAQDAVTLATVPLLLWAAHRARRGSLRAHVLWLGLQTWLAYCYVHLATGAPFNAMFLAYVAILGLAAFALLDGLLRTDVTVAATAFDRAPARGAAWFLLVGGIGIAGLWLSDIVPALGGGLPAGIHLAELPSPTWVFDLAWLIPASIAAAVLLRRDHPAGALVAGTLLVALFVLSVGMLAIAPFAITAGISSQPAVATQLVVFSIVFGLLGAIEGWLLSVGGSRMRDVGAAWLRPGWWS